MLQFFRNFFRSKVGIVITLAFLGLIALAFASGDVANTGTFGGVSGGDRVAVVGDEKMSTSDLISSVRNGFNRAREQSPTLSMEAYIAQGGLDADLTRGLDRMAVAEFGKKYGLRAGHRLIDSELVKMQAFAGATGEFDQEVYEAALRQNGLTDAMVRDQVGASLLAGQVLLPVNSPGFVPASLAKRYAALPLERRKGSIGTILSEVYAPEKGPQESVLNAYYEANRETYLQPERRVIRYAIFGEEAVKDSVEPSEDEIAARYASNSELYGASEERTFSQLVVPTEAAAKAVLDEVKAGKSLATAAKEKGLAVSQVGPIKRAELATQASQAVAQAGFAANQGSMADVVRGPLGYYVLRVNNVTKRPGRSLDQVRAEIVAALKEEKLRQSLAELSSEIEDQIDDGASLTNLANELDLKVQESPALLADGTVFDDPAKTSPAELQRILSTAFAMDEGDRQIAAMASGEQFLIFEVSDITKAAPAPLASIKEVVTEAWRKEQGNAKAKEAAQRVMKRVEDGMSLAKAMAEEKVKLPKVDDLDMTQAQVAAMRNRVPPVLALFFSMAKDTTKRLEAPNNNGWFVVKLNDIEAGKVEDGDPIIETAADQLAMLAGNEQGDQLILAIKEEIGIEKNQTAIDAVTAQLIGQN